MAKSLALCLPLCLIALALAGCDAPPAGEAPGNTPAANAPVASAPPTTAPEKSGDATPTGKGVPVVMETSMGTIELELDKDKAPVTVKNFVDYAKKGQYNGTVFHRVIRDFMIQGGGFSTDLKEKKTGSPIKNEGQNGLHNARGTIAMARTSDPDSATAQFFINVEDNTDKLDYPINGGYAVFGKVTKGMDVVDKIRETPTGTKTATAMGPGGKLQEAPFQDVPLENVVIKSVKVKE